MKMRATKKRRILYFICYGLTLLIFICLFCYNIPCNIVKEKVGVDIPLNSKIIYYHRDFFNGYDFTDIIDEVDVKLRIKNEDYNKLVDELNILSYNDEIINQNISNNDYIKWFNIVNMPIEGEIIKTYRLIRSDEPIYLKLFPKLHIQYVWIVFCMENEDIYMYISL